MRKLSYILMLMLLPSFAFAQIGVHRNDFSIGVNGGYNMSSVKFTPKVSQSQLGGINAGLSARYVCEKYFNTICSVYGEINYSQMGWKEDILDVNDQPVINSTTGLPEEYQRTISYIQVPVMAHLAWGRERKGVAFFVNVGPQFGYCLSETTKTNFNFSDRNMADRVNPVCAQDTMAIENKFDYGILVGAGLETIIKRKHSVMLEARMYYGLGNIFSSSKKDVFSASRGMNITVTLGYMFRVK